MMVSLQTFWNGYRCLSEENEAAGAICLVRSGQQIIENWLSRKGDPKQFLDELPVDVLFQGLLDAALMLDFANI